MCLRVYCARSVQPTPLPTKTTLPPSFEFGFSYRLQFKMWWVVSGEGRNTFWDEKTKIFFFTHNDRATNCGDHSHLSRFFV